MNLREAIIDAVNAHDRAVLAVCAQLVVGTPRAAIVDGNDNTIHESARRIERLVEQIPADITARRMSETERVHLCEKMIREVEMLRDLTTGKADRDGEPVLPDPGRYTHILAVLARLRDDE